MKPDRHDPHRLKSFSKRQMVRRQQDKDPPPKWPKLFQPGSEQTADLFYHRFFGQNGNQATLNCLPNGFYLKPNGHNLCFSR
jgi:hypothetical protein